MVKKQGNAIQINTKLTIRNINTVLYKGWKTITDPKVMESLLVVNSREVFPYQVISWNT